VRSAFARQTYGAIGRPEGGVSVAPRDHQYPSSLPLQFPYRRHQPVSPGDNSVRPELLGDAAHQVAPSPGDDEKQVGAAYSSREGLSQRIDLSLQSGQPYHRPLVGDADHPCVATGEHPRLGRHATRHLYRLGAQHR
jgi:hypothetical protein